jgi:hypothetical protein
MSVIQMIFGALVTAIGVALFYLNKGSGQNRFVIFGQTIEVSTPALVIIILGCAIFILPAILPLWLAPSPSPLPPAQTELKGQERLQDTPKKLEKLVEAKRSQKELARETIKPGVVARITEFALQNGAAVVEITFTNTGQYDANFCTRPNSWYITDEINDVRYGVSYGGPLLSSGGSAICGTPDWKQMGPGSSAKAIATIKCETGADDSWSLYVPELKQLARGLRFER